jgi:hypothetical protein
MTSDDIMVTGDIETIDFEKIEDWVRRKICFLEF